MLFNKKLLFLTIFLIFIIIPVSFAENTTDIATTGQNGNAVYVNSVTGSDSDGNGSQLKPYSTINKAISSCNDNGNIVLNGTFRYSGNYNLDISKNTANNLTFVGVGNTVINGMGSNYIFSVTSGSVSFYNLTIMNGYKAGRGAAISITSGETLLIKNVTFTSNTVAFSPKGYGGGAVYASKGNVYIYDSTFTKNEVKMAGNAGALYLMNGASAHIFNTTFSNNTAYLGGAVYASTNCTLDINGSVFYANNVYGNGAVTRYGGAVYTTNLTKIDNSLFVSNLASGGGAVYSTYDGGLSINNTRFYYNVATAGSGGAVLASGEVRINNSRFIQNDALGGSGGAVNSLKTSVTQSAFVNNTGFAIASNSINASYSSFIDNEVDGDDLNIDYNWWGVNSPNIDSDKYVVLTITSASDLISIGESADIYVNLYWFDTLDSTGIDMIPLDNISLTATGGVLNDYRFTATSVGVFDVIARLNNEVQSVKIEVETVEQSVVYVSRDGSDLNVGLKKSPVQTLKRAFEIANNNPDIVKIILDNATYSFNNLVLENPITITGDNLLINSSNLTFNSMVNISGISFNNTAIIFKDTCVIKDSKFTTSYISADADDSSITYSYLINSKISSASIMDISYNWWGCNNPQWNNILEGTDKPSVIAVLNISSNKNNVFRKEAVEIYTGLYWNSTNTLSNFTSNITLSSDGGVLDNSQFSSHTIGKFNITASLDSQHQNLTVNVIPKDLTILYVDVNGNDSDEGSSDDMLASLTRAVEIANNNSKITKIIINEGSYSGNELEISTDITVEGNGYVVICQNLNINSNVVFDNLNFKDTTIKGFKNLTIADTAFKDSILNAGNITVSKSDFTNTTINCDNLIMDYSKIYNSKISTYTVDLQINEIINSTVKAVKDSRIYLNALINTTVSGDIDVNCNWWGESNPSWDSILNNTLIPKAYAVINLSVSTSNLKINQIATVYVKLYWNNTLNQDNIYDIPRRTLNLISDGLDITVSGFTLSRDFQTTAKSSAPNNYTIKSVVDLDIQEVTLNVTSHNGLKIVYVNSTGSDEEGKGTIDNPVRTIKKALSIVGDNGTVILNGYFAGDGNHEIIISSATSSNLTFIGVGDTVVDGEGKYWLFEITKGDAVFTNITFTNAYKQGFGSVIQISTLLHLILNNIVAFSNVATNGGCGAVIYAGYVDINGGSFYDNQASLRGGAMVVLGHANISDALFMNNVVNNQGAGIYAGTVNITDSSFIKNRVHGSGGAIYLTSTQGYSIIKDSLFDSNMATEEYGASISTRARLDIIHCEFLSNTANASGAVDNSGNLTIRDSLFAGNNATGRDAGAVSNMLNANIINTTFINNHAFRNGGAVKNQGETLTVTDCVFINNTAAGYDTGSYGGAVYAWMAQNNIANTSFIINTASSRGGAVYASAGNGGEATLDITGCEFLVNNAAIGGGLFIESAYGDVKYSAFINSTIYSNINTDVNYNWWGESNPKWLSLFNRMIDTPNVYAVLNATLIPSKIYYGDVCEFNFKLNWNGTDISANIPKRIITVSASGGSLSKTTGDLGVFKCNFTLAGDNNMVKAVVDNEILTYSFDSRKNTTMDVIVSNITVGETLTITVRVNATGNVIVNTDSLRFNLTLKDNACSVNLNGLNSGKHIIDVSYLGDKYNTPVNRTVTVDVSKRDSLIKYEIPKIYENKKAQINVSLDGNATGIVEITVGSTKYSADLKNANVNMLINGLASGKYNITIRYLGDDTYKGSEISTQIDVIGVVITAPTVIKYFGGSERFKITLNLDDKPITDSKVSIIINGVEYKKITNSNGSASIALNINSGIYEVVVIYENSTTSSNVTIMPTVFSHDISKIYRNASQFSANFTDEYGNVLKSSQVTFNINGIYYLRNTNANGVARLNINLQPGEYTITSINPKTGEMLSNKVVVYSSIVENNDLVMYYRNASQYSVKILNSAGESLAGAEVKFNINGMIYTRTTNSNGIAKLNINLQPGDYIITAEYNDLRVSNNISVLNVIITGDLTMSYRDGSRFEARLLDGHGNYLKGKTLTFNINGMIYEKTSDVDGISRLNINLMSGEYIITTSYNGLNVANKITIS